MRARLMLGLAAAGSLAAGMFSNPLVERHFTGEAVARSTAPAPPPSVSIQSEIVTAPTIGRPPVPKARRTTTRAAALRRAAAPKRPLLARVLLGNGENRPQPFPRPDAQER